MPVCPECGQFINNVIEETKCYRRDRLTVDESGFSQYDSMDLSDSEEDYDQIYCPKCNEVLFDNDIDAIEFLNKCRVQEYCEKCEKCEDRFKCWTTNKK